MVTGYFSDNDPLRFSATFLSSGFLFKGPGLDLSGNPASGNLWVNLPRATYGKLQAHPMVIDRRVLDRTLAKSFAQYFRKQSNAAQIPWILGPASLIPGVGAIITVETSTLDAIQRLKAGSVNSDQMAVLVAAGGAFLKILALARNSRITASVTYRVSVGDEARSYGICSQTFALNIV